MWVSAVRHPSVCMHPWLCVCVCVRIYLYIYIWVCMCVCVWPLENHTLALLHPGIGSHELRIQKWIFTNTSLDPFHQPTKKDKRKRESYGQQRVTRCTEQRGNECVCVCAAGGLTQWQWWKISLCWLPADTEGFPLRASSVGCPTPPWCYCCVYTQTHTRRSETERAQLYYTDD